MTAKAMADDRVRLHITPFNSDLLDRYIPPSLRPQATNISFHTVETFPERGFGYVELPAMEAQKLKKKLNGSTLKGAKVKIENAKSEKKRKIAGAAEEAEDEIKARKKVKKEKREREDGVMPGHELEEGRHVKRGWTEDASKKSKKKDKESIKDKKMKFKTEVPLNKVPNGKESNTTKPKEQEEAKKPKTGKKAVVVKEFSKSSKPNTTGALGGKKGALTYEEGTGWVDADGNVVEGEPPSKKRTRTKAAEADELVKANTKKKPTRQSSPEPDSESESASEPSSSEISSSSESEAEDSTDESEMGEEEDNVDRQLNEAKNNTASNAAAERERQYSTPIPSAEPNAAPKGVHPLEALFKRAPPKIEDTSKPKKPSPIDTSFSFFNSGADDEDQPMAENNIPQTPHTREDLEWRSMRSAAPTPDTAAIGKRFNFDFTGKDDAEDEGSVDEDVHMQDAGSPQARAGAQKTDKEESEFRKWFYDNRGDLNRSWKKRRREERKIVRQRENRRLSRRVA